MGGTNHNQGRQRLIRPREMEKTCRDLGSKRNNSLSLKDTVTHARSYKSIATHTVTHVVLKPRVTYQGHVHLSAHQYLLPSESTQECQWDLARLQAQLDLCGPVPFSHCIRKIIDYRSFYPTRTCASLQTLFFTHSSQVIFVVKGQQCVFCVGLPISCKLTYLKFTRLHFKAPCF